ncbi:MAG TPA: hypothetical protein VMV49_03260 [Candidatus Deferrimicrobium sp.]|nr:hypothetical protein [Candidatus Deferrimicrobium sp.]
MKKEKQSESKTSSNGIQLEVEVPTAYFSTWQSATILSLIQSSHEPDELDETSIQQPIQHVKVFIPLDFMTYPKLELDLSLNNATKKQLKRALVNFYQQCNAKVKTLEIPDIFWK